MKLFKTLRIGLFLLPILFLYQNCGNNLFTTMNKNTTQGSHILYGPKGTIVVNMNSSPKITDSDFVHLVLDATDEVGITGYYISELETTPSLSDPKWYFVDSTKMLHRTPGIKLSANNGQKTIYAWFRNEINIISDRVSDSVNYQKNESWKNWFAITWRGDVQGNIRFAKQLGYEYIGIGTREVNNSFNSDYKNNSNVSGMNFYVVGPHSIAYKESRTFDKSKTNYSQEQISWYLNNTVWKSITSSFPNNLATGWWYSENRFNTILDFQQKRVADNAVKAIIERFREYQNAVKPGDAGYPFRLAGHIWDVAHLGGDFNNYCPPENCPSLNDATTLSEMSGQVTNSSPLHPLYNDAGQVIGQITHEYLTFEDGYAAFIKQLNEKMRKEFPNAKWIIEPTMLYGSTEQYINEYLRHTSRRTDADELVPDMLSSESVSMETDWVDDPRNFSTKIIVTKDRVGVSTANRNFYEEEVERIFAGRAGMNWAWTNWFGRWDSDAANSIVHFSLIEDMYPRLKLIRCIANWDNLRSIPIAQREWNHSTSVYSSFKASSDSYPMSYIDANLIYSRHWKTNKLFAVFTQHEGVIKLNPGENISAVSRVNGFFEESGNGIEDFIITGNEIRLKTTITIPVDNLAQQIKGIGYIFTLNQ